MDREDRKKIQMDTIARIQRNPQINEDTIAIMHRNVIPNNDRETYHTKVYITESDTLDATQFGQMVFGRRFCAMIMGNSYRKGGGYLNGAAAQEESICRRTNLHHCFETLQYPINEFGNVYIRNLRILKDVNHLPCEIIGYCDAIIACALQHPTLGRHGNLSNSDFNITKNKLRAMFYSCLNHGMTHLVLGAFGCGAFGNPPHQIAQIYLELLTSEFLNKFEVVMFSIIDNRHTHNCEIFQSVLKPLLSESS